MERKPAANETVMQPLNREEDDDLRRLEQMRSFGALSPTAARRYAELRRRDRRKTVRPVEDVVVVVPAPRAATDDEQPGG